ncbi:MAG: hypothetical protein K5894_12305 [Lachnospiraceae bacterium]|nr:hypothetical protein [Lachnospiraceae bacterium]
MLTAELPLPVLAQESVIEDQEQERASEDQPQESVSEDQVSENEVSYPVLNKTQAIDDAELKIQGTGEDEDMLSVPLTLEAVNEGTTTITFNNERDQTIKYSIDGEEKTAVSDNIINIDLNKGQTVQLYGDGTKN